MNIKEDLPHPKANLKPEITASSTQHNHPSTELLFENPQPRKRSPSDRGKLLLGVEQH